MPIEYVNSPKRGHPTSGNRCRQAGLAEFSPTFAANAYLKENRGATLS